RTGEEYLNFYDAAAPIIEADSIDMDNAYFGARYGKGTADYINCPLTKEEYLAFYENLINAETIPLKENIENPKVFEGCMPVEIMAKRGVDTLRFGPLKPVGLINPKTGKEDYAVLQLRQDDVAKTMYNMVGFQTNLKWGEQKRVFSMIPALKNAVFLRYGVMHRNTYINSPKVLQKTLNLKSDPNVFFAGQITGVEGYMESAACGIIAGINAARLVLGKEMLILPQNTMMGALINYITTEGKGDFQPMNANFGIIDKGGIKAKNKKERYAEIADRSLETIKKIAQNI
ncbi:MAG: FADH(2)-oxidizing methylenetetrahydrofolate--tRNA-(uracil(54)-C(5))-methyltransferase TrmFO, partial [Clostridiaceae bacterium]|nr:FADH(2)-oxidizing methylenetetrahydrofolate--tRNA-(uracil(54)-C(5))-methyltransferase TrmFO [Clostridiaceae bacterium]